MTTTATKAYPGPRPDRGDPVPSSTPTPTQVGAGGGASGRVWPFRVREASGVAIAVGGPFAGPGIIQSITANYTADASSPFPSFQLYYSEEGGGGGFNLANGTVPGGTPVFDNVSQAVDDAFTVEGGVGFTFFNVSPGTGMIKFPINRVVRKPSFFLKLRVGRSIVQGADITGVITLLESVPEDVLANFR